MQFFGLWHECMPSSQNQKAWLSQTIWFHHLLLLCFADSSLYCKQFNKMSLVWILVLSMVYHFLLISLIFLTFFLVWDNVIEVAGMVDNEGLATVAFWLIAPMALI